MLKGEDPERSMRGPGFREEQGFEDPALTQEESPAQPAEAPVPVEDPGMEEQDSGQELLDQQTEETAQEPIAGAPPRPRRPPVANTPLGIAGTQAQVGSEAAMGFRTPNFFTNRIIGGGGAPQRFGTGSGSSLGGAFAAPGVQSPTGAAKRRPGMSDEDLMMAIQASQGGGPFGM